MRLIYEGRDITESVNIVSAVYRDTLGGRCDTLELTLEYAEEWFSWAPKMNDAMEIKHDAYYTGKLFLNTIVPDGARFRLLATSVPASGAKRASKSFRNITLNRALDVCAAELGLKSKLYGMNGETILPFLLRDNESAPAFMQRVLKREGALMKIFDGKMIGIDIARAQKLSPLAQMRISVKQEGVCYVKRETKRLSSLTVVSLDGEEATAWDEEATSGIDSKVCAPAYDRAEARRWARGMLLTNNREAETLTLETEDNLPFTALTRIDITGDMNLPEAWTIEEAEHDFVAGSCKLTLVRAIESVKI